MYMTIQEKNKMLQNGAFRFNVIINKRKTFLDVNSAMVKSFTYELYGTNKNQSLIFATGHLQEIIEKAIFKCDEFEVSNKKTVLNSVHDVIIEKILRIATDKTYAPYKFKGLKEEIEIINKRG